MTKKINPGLFVRLMQDPARARKDLLEYLGEGPVNADDVLRLSAVQGATPRDTILPDADDTICPR